MPRNNPLKRTARIGAEWLLARLSEKSTRIGLAALLVGAVGPRMNPSNAQHIADALALLCSGTLVLMKEDDDNDDHQHPAPA
ncbi:hypothetical protein [Acetobacter sp. UBA5411]|uniref:hypothetical protein n=1 Tax=Acetobacter sp. UBA5411 TaxID=1945905 RepID=UPI0025C4BBC1|nr:hypothetical protein [Acetobacter sp. UBA5411]